MHTMTGKKHKAERIDLKALAGNDREFLRQLIRTTLQEVLEAEMTEALAAAKSERTVGRNGYRSGYYGRSLITRVGKLELRIPQDRSGRFSTELFERYQRSERALVAALAEMYVQGVSTRKVKAITAARSSASNSPIAKAARAGATSCADSRRAGWLAFDRSSLLRFRRR
jgi:transposase-like protein